MTGDLQASENARSKGVDVRGGLPGGQLGMISAATLVNLVPYDVYDAWVTLPKPEAGGTGGAMKPVPAAAPEGSGLDLKAFQNLGYTGEWFVFAGFVLFMWFRLVRREAEAARDVALGLVPDGAEAGSEESGAGAAGAEESSGAAGPEGSETGADRLEAGAGGSEAGSDGADVGPVGSEAPAGSRDPVGSQTPAGSQDAVGSQGSGVAGDVRAAEAGSGR
ncbi:SURF1 family protein [Streptomyces californicus]